MEPYCDPQYLWWHQLLQGCINDQSHPKRQANLHPGQSWPMLHFFVQLVWIVDMKKKFDSYFSKALAWFVRDALFAQHGYLNFTPSPLCCLLRYKLYAGFPLLWNCIFQSVKGFCTVANSKVEQKLPTCLPKLFPGRKWLLNKHLHLWCLWGCNSTRKMEC